MPIQAIYVERRRLFMFKGFSTGIIAGAIIGATIGMLADPINDKQHKKIKRQTGNMFRTLGSVVDSVIDCR